MNTKLEFDESSELTDQPNNDSDPTFDRKRDPKHIGADVVTNFVTAEIVGNEVDGNEVAGKEVAGKEAIGNEIDSAAIPTGEVVAPANRVSEFVDAVVVPVDDDEANVAVEAEVSEVSDEQTSEAAEATSSSDTNIDLDANTDVGGHVTLEVSRERSLPFKIGGAVLSASGWCFGFASLIVGLAAIAVIPIVQILSLGYFLEVCGRIGRTGKVREGFIGIRKASRVGSIVMGTWIMLLPIRYLSTLWYSSQLIDPSSTQTSVLRVLQIIATVLIVAHIVAVWYCGGRLRHFFWPIVAPFSILVWVMRFIAATPELRRLLNGTVGAISPRFVQDFCNVKPITNWFLPAILIKGLASGELFRNACDGLWDFVMSLRLRYYFSLGLRGFLTSLAWLIIPALFLIGATKFEDGAAVLCGLIGVPLMAIVIIYLPFAQAHFAAEGNWKSMFDISGIRHAFVRAPMRFWMAMFVLLALAIPLFLFQIEKTYEELEWLESLVFVLFLLPARFLIGWAYARGRHRENKSVWPLTWATRFAQIPIAMIFVFFVFLTRYTSMNGVWSIFDQPAFLVPAPFTEWLF